MAGACQSTRTVTDDLLSASEVTPDDKVKVVREVHRTQAALESEWEVETTLAPAEYLARMNERLVSARYKILDRGDSWIYAGRADESDMFRLRVEIVRSAPTRAVLKFRVSPY
jgi:hypothetical protein